MAPHKCNCILRADMAPQHLIFVVLVGKVPSLVDSVLGVVPGVSIPRGDVRFPCVTPQAKPDGARCRIAYINTTSCCRVSGFLSIQVLLFHW
jgi:hypothetical protein